MLAYCQNIERAIVSQPYYWDTLAFRRVSDKVVSMDTFSSVGERRTLDLTPPVNPDYVHPPFLKVVIAGHVACVSALILWALSPLTVTLH